MFPAKIMTVNEADILYFRKASVLKPRELLIGQEIFLPPDKKPYSVRRNVQNFNF